MSATLKEIQAKHYECTKALKVLEQDMLRQAGNWRHIVSMDLATRKSTIGAAHEYSSHTVQTALKCRQVDKALKDQWRVLTKKMQSLSDSADNITDEVR